MEEKMHAALRLVRGAATGARGSQLQESALLSELEAVTLQLRQYKGASGAREVCRQALAACHVVTEGVAFLARQRPPGHETGSSAWPKRIFALETTVMAAFAVVQGSGGVADEAEDLLASAAWRHLCSAFGRLMARFFRASQSPQHAHDVVLVMTRMCVLLACCWLSYERELNLSKATELLTTCRDFCLSHEPIKHLAKLPLFLLAMLHLVETQDHKTALACFRSGSLPPVGSEEAEEKDCAFHYWFAVTLYRNGFALEAAAALDKCIRGDYEPVACLSLQALMRLQARDFHEAAEQLQRALEIDFSQSLSMFNYALLLGRMHNFEAQQRMLEYFQEANASPDAERPVDKKRKRRSDGAQPPVATLFDEAKLASLLPSQLTHVNPRMVRFRLAIASMENGRHRGRGWYSPCYSFWTGVWIGSTQMPEAARDYVFVLLQCNLPSLALSKCDRFLGKYADRNASSEDAASVAVLLLHLYKADALLCLERVDECLEYLKRIAQPKILELMQQIHEADADQGRDSASAEIRQCHTQLLNNLAVATVCRDGVAPAVVILSEGLRQYPDCLPLKFNLVLLFWRNDNKMAACAMWIEARGWNLQMRASDLASAGVNDVANPLALVAACENAAVAATAPPNPALSEHVQSNGDEEGGVTQQQLLYLDALVLNHWRQIRNSSGVENSLQYIEYLESVGTSDRLRTAL
ncbi:hypothetical protein BBJ28_00013660 [Nothophytophthora sp. Chile5]|nr:hypothetical protein BBJ28_00013660 [Nothophytophthora sp. Chile5]